MHNKIYLIIVLLIAAFIGIIIAIDIGTADYEQLAIYSAVGLVIYFFINGWRNVWWFTSLLIFSSVGFQHGFDFNADHLFVLMLGLASLMFVISRGPMQQAPEFRIAGSKSTSAATGMILAYGFIHFIVYYAFPYSPNEYSLKTCLKAYFECYASMICCFWLMVGPYGFNLKPSWPKRLIFIMIICVAANVVVRAAMFLMGFQAADGLDDGAVSFSSMTVPIINMYAGIFTLRNICPLVCIILFMIATGNNWWKSNKFGMRFTVISGISLCLIGATFSGGRATVPLCIFLLLLGALLRRQIVLVSLIGMSMVLLVAGLNLFSHEINTKAPLYIARSVQMVIIEKGDAYDTIDASQETRDAARKEAISQWQKDNRVFFFGRSVFHISADEAIFMKSQYGLNGFVDNAMKGGRTHNMITDLLLQYGIVGCILYVAAYFMVIRFILRLRKALSNDDGFIRWLLDAMSIYLPIMFVYQALSGTFMPIVVPLVIGLARAHLVTLKNRELIPVLEQLPRSSRDQNLAALADRRPPPMLAR